MGFISRWLSDARRFFKFQYAVALILLFIISFIGQGLLDTRFDDQWQFLEKDIPQKELTSNISMPLVISEVEYNITDDPVLEKIERNPMNIPKELLQENGLGYEADGKCSQLPELKEIIFDNTYWQTMKTSSDISFYLYSAYYDRRSVLGGDAYVKVNAMRNGPKKIGKIYCKFWYKIGNKVKSSSTILESHRLKNMKKLNSSLTTHLIDCKVPRSKMERIPFGISISESKCGKVTNILRVDYNEISEDMKKDFAVCVKGLDFPFKDLSHYLTEWIELLGIMGVEKVYLYELNVHPNISQVLQYYKNKGRIEILPLSLPGDQPNSPRLMHDYLVRNIEIKRAHEKLPYNDCLFRNMNIYRFIAILDIDEIIVPMKTETWRELLDSIHLKSKRRGAINQTSYTFKKFLGLNTMNEYHKSVVDIPNYMYMLRNVYRSQDSEDDQGKSLLNTNAVIAANNHIPKCKGPCTVYDVPVDQAYILHFRDNCKDDERSSCDEKVSIKDTNLWKYKEDLINRTTDTLTKLKLIP